MPDLISCSSAWIVVALGLLASPALAQICAVDPISPLCCPSPCPVMDMTRIPKLLADLDDLDQAVKIETQVVQTASQMKQTIGDGAAAATLVSQQASSFAGTLSAEVSSIQNGLSANPVQALIGVKQVLFEPGTNSSTATQLATRLSARVAAAQEEQAAAFAVSLMRSKALSSLASQQAQLAGGATGAQQLQGDMAANSTSRLAIYQSAGAIHQLIAAWVAQRSIQAAIRHPDAGGGTSAQSGTASEAQSSLQSSTASQALADNVDQLVTLHDDRNAAQAVLAAYPALQQTVASAALAEQVANQAEAGLQQAFSAVGLSASSLPQVKTALTALDATGWLDSAKTVSAQQAALQVSARLLGISSRAQANADDVNAAVQQLQPAMTTWLDAIKQSRYWSILAAQAQQSIAILDKTLGALSDQAGADVAGEAGGISERELIAKLSADPASARWKALLMSASQDQTAQSVLSVAR